MDLLVRSLTLELATQLAPELVAMGADMEWETWTPENLLSDLPGKFELSQVAFDGETPAGYLIASLRDNLVHIHHIVISPAHRGQGIGSRLLRTAARLARDRYGLDTARLKVHRTNPRAISLYERLGFQLVSQTGELNTMTIPIGVLLAANGGR